MVKYSRQPAEPSKCKLLSLYYRYWFKTLLIVNLVSLISYHCTILIDGLVSTRTRIYGFNDCLPRGVMSWSIIIWNCWVEKQLFGWSDLAGLHARYHLFTRFFFTDLYSFFNTYFSRLNPFHLWPSQKWYQTGSYELFSVVIPDYSKSRLQKGRVVDTYIHTDMNGHCSWSVVAASKNG